MDIKVTGFAELSKELAGYERKLHRKVLSKAVRAGSNVVKKEARKNAPKRIKSWDGMNYPNPAGNLRKGIITRRVKRQPRFIMRDRIGFSGKAWYGFLVEKGHKLVRGGKVIGHVAAKPFLRPAFDNNESKIFDEMRKVFKQEVDKLK